MTSPANSTTELTVERLRVRILSAELANPVPMSFSQLSARQLCLVELHADGLVGIGESWINYPPWAPAERVATLCDGVAEVLLGQRITDVASTHQRLASTLGPLGRQWGAPGPIWQAISGVDLALWDLFGQATDRSVAACLADAGTTAGGVHPDAAHRGLPAYGSGVGPTDVAELTTRALARGLPAVKLKVGFGREADTASLATVRQVAGEQLRLFADANQAWDPDEARLMAELLADHGVEWLEEPLAGDDLASLEKLHAATAMPLATGENLYGLDAFARYADSPAVAHIQPDVSKTGGLTLANQLCDHLEGGGPRGGDPRGGDDTAMISPHCYGGAITLAASLQLGAAHAGVDWIELDVRDNPLRTTLLQEPLTLESGLLHAPAGTGLGITLDPAIVRQYQVLDTERTPTRNG